MSLLSCSTKRQLSDYAIVGIGGCAIHLALKCHILTAIGIMYLIFIIVDVFMTLVGDIVVPMMFARVYPKEIREIKHDAKHYQYVANINGKERYSPLYNRPLDQVEIRCYKNIGKYVFQVLRKKTK